MKLEKVSQVFSFIDAPILFINDLSLSNLNSENIESLRNTDLEIKKVLKEFTTNPVYIDQIINIIADSNKLA